MEFRPLHHDLGAEVLGFDVLRDGSRSDLAALRNAYDRFGLLLFRECGTLPGERQLEIASWFGPPPPVANGAADDYVTVLHNGDAAGRAELQFHSDLTYTEAPIHGICLHALELPGRPTSTSYVSGVAAWQRLSPALRDELDGCTVRHELVSVMAARYDWPPFVAVHPLKLVHPRTGVPILLVTEHHARRILQLDEARSRELLDRLFAELYAPESRYEHWWQPGDMLMWDNLMLQHARTEEAEPQAGRRALQRVALSTVALPELVERARARAAA